MLSRVLIAALVVDGLKEAVEVKHALKPHVIVVFVVDLSIHANLNIVTHRNLNLDPMAETADSISSGNTNNLDILGDCL